MATNKDKLISSLFKVGIFFIGFILLFIISLTAIPYFFKDEINAKTKSEINKRLNAKVNYEELDLSFFSNFPYLSINLTGFNIKGKSEFEKDTLISLQELQLAVNVMNIFNKEKIEVKKIILDNPNIHARMLADGRNNWDIMIPDTVPPTAPDSVQTAFSIGLSKIKIIDATIKYDDQKGKQLALIKKFNFEGNGDMTQDNFDFETLSKIESVYYKSENTTYANNLAINAEINLGVDSKNKKYTIRENKLKVNDLQLGLNGTVETQADSSYIVDIQFKALETQFKEILSMVPGAYTKDFANIKTEGSFNLDGKAKGKYSTHSYPAFSVNLNIKDGFLHYPDLPAPVKNIQVAFNASNESNNLDDMSLNIKRLHLEFENNPIDIRALIHRLKNYTIDADIKAKVDLSKLSRAFPIENFDLKGQLNANANLKGTASENTLPAFNGNLELKYGYIKYKNFPSALDNLTINVKGTCETGDKKDAHIEVTNFHAEIDKSPIDASLILQNLDNPNYRLKLKGDLDLSKLSKIYPIEGTTLIGQMKANVDASGDMTKVEAGDYVNMPASGFIELSDMDYSSKDLAQKVHIHQAKLEFTPQNLNLVAYDGTVGSSDVNLKGKIENYLGYIFKNEKLKGQMTFVSNHFNCNEWLSDEKTPTNKEQEQNLEPFDVPENIDFNFKSNIKQLDYDTWKIENFNGDIIMQNKSLKLSNMLFQLAGAKFRVNGGYDSNNLANPSYEFDLKIDTLKFIEAYKTFTAVEKLAPIAERIEGAFNCKISTSGILNSNMKPVYEKLSASGALNILRSKITGVPVLEKISEVTKINTYKELALKALNLTFQIIDGKLYFEPFNIKQGENIMTISGYNALDQSIKYKINLDVPAPAVTQTAANSISKLTNREISVSERVNFDLQVIGTYLKPIVSGGNAKDLKDNLVQDIKSSAADEVKKKKEEAKEILNAKKKELEDKAKQEIENKKKELEQKAIQEKERLQQEANRKKQEAEEKLRSEKERLKQEAERKKKEEEEKAKKELENQLKNKLKFPR